MDINIISLKNNSWMKMVRWGCVFFVLACAFALALIAPECILRHIGIDGIDLDTRILIYIMFVVSAVASIWCVVWFIASSVKRWLTSWYESRQWKGKSARHKILSLSVLAQEEVREHVERKMTLRLNAKGNVYKELKNGNFIEKVTNESDVIVDCKLKGWVLECFAKYPDLVKELCEMDEAYRELDQTFPY